MRRLPDWPIRLAAAVDAARHRPFAWGEHDCAMFAFNVARDLTGQDLVAHYRGAYGTARGAARALRRLGTGDLRGSVGALLGAEIPVPMASRGDVVMWDQGAPGDTLGICLGATAAFVGPTGLVQVGVSKCFAAWRV